MSDEYDNDSISYSSFWPLVILLAGLILWTGYQVFAAGSQRNFTSKQLENAMPTITAAQNMQTRYVALMKDLVQTAGKDPNAASIVKEAAAAGMIRINPPSETNSTTTPAAPTPDPNAAK